MKQNKNILNYLFICIVINMIPTIMLGTFNVPVKVYTMANGIAYFVELMLMIYSIRKNIMHISNKKISMILLLACVQLITQGINYIKQHNIILEDIINIMSVTTNIFIFILCVPYSEVNEKDTVNFMKKIVILGIAMGIFNLIKNGTKMLQLSKLISSYSVSFSSLFPNRNQFGIFMIISVLSNLYVRQYNKNSFYRLTEIFFIFNLAFTMSRNSILGLFCVYVFKFILDIKKKNTTKKKILLGLLAMLIIVCCMVVVISNEKYIEVVYRLIIRPDTLETGSGRTIVWKNGIEIAIKNNIVLGVGRFKGIELNKTVYNSDLEYFHSLYVETLVTYGVIGIILMAVLFKFIIKGIKKCFLKEGHKNVLLTAIGVFLVISIFETTTRFSIGYADMMSMIYFITVPIVFSNANKDSKNN